MDAVSTIARIPHRRSPTSSAVKARQQGAWSSGDYAVVGTTLQIVGEELCEALDVRAGQRVLDVAGGNGNVSLAAARRWCDVVRRITCRRCSNAPANARTRNGSRSTSARPTPKRCRSPTRASTSWSRRSASCSPPIRIGLRRSCLRVCKPGGKIGLANWTPDGFIGQLFKVIGKHVPPPAGVKSPALWGTRARLAELFEADASSIESAQRTFAFRYRSPAALPRRSSRRTTARCSRRLPALAAGRAGRVREPTSGARRAVQPRRRRHDGRARASTPKSSSRGDDTFSSSDSRSKGVHHANTEHRRPGRTRHRARRSAAVAPARSGGRRSGEAVPLQSRRSWSFRERNGTRKPPPPFSPGTTVAVLSGDPSAPAAPYTIRLKFPDGARIPVHAHGGTENVTVLRGSFLRRDRLDVRRVEAARVAAGIVRLDPTGFAHYAMASGETVVNVSGIGPESTTLVK